MSAPERETGFRARLGDMRERAKRPEDSAALRLIVLAAVMVAIVAVLAQGAVGSQVALAALTLTPLGFWISWQRRDKRNIVLKIALAAALFMALGAFINDIRWANSVDDARAALASLFIWVQVIHAFDLPRLRDLSFSMGAAVVLMAEAGALSLDTSYGLFLIAFAALGGVWLYLSQRSVAERAAGPTTLRHPGRAPGRDRRRFPVRAIAVTAVLALLAATVVFLFIPRMPGAAIKAPPFSLQQAVGIQGFSGQVVNPAASLGGNAGQPAGGTFFSPDAYPGFGDQVDLRMRGSLSDDIVMKVRSPEGAFWRGQAYDTWNGTTWTASSTDFAAVTGEPDFRVPQLDTYEDITAPVTQLVQTFYVQANQPNIVFGAYRPTNVYFPAPKVVVDPYLSIRAPILMEDGVVYSVISDVTLTTPRTLRETPDQWPPDLPEQYTQLPASLPARVVQLAHRITDDAPTTYDKVIAVQRWLRANTRYNLNIPPDPPGVDAVDYFLFERREGFCEHLASAMAVLLRAVGIPTRFAVGFDEGERNPFTGYFEVRESDAHAWVEVYYPTVGWIQYDPTHGTPIAEGGLRASFIAPQVFKAIGRFLSSVTPEPIKAAFGAATRGVAALARGSLAAWPLVVGGVVVLGLIAWALSRSRRRRRAPSLRDAAAAFDSVCQTFGLRGHPRPDSRTPAEHLRTLLKEDELARTVSGDLTLVIGTFERETYAPDGPSSDEVTEARGAALRVKELAGARVSPRR